MRRPTGDGPRRRRRPADGRRRHAGNRRSPTQFLAYRITNPTYRLVHLVPPFQQVLVQKVQPVPGQVYNVLFVAVQNKTAQTFTAANDFRVRLPGFTGTHRVVDNAFPVLTGNQVWKPKTWIVFYALSKKYYPLSPQVAAGFQLNAGGRSSTLVPGPSGIFLRLTYDPATFARTARLDRGLWPGCAAGRRLGPRPARHGHQLPRRGEHQPAGFRRATSDRPSESRRGCAEAGRSHRVAGGGPLPTGGRNFGRVSVHRLDLAGRVLGARSPGRGSPARGTARTAPGCTRRPW